MPPRRFHGGDEDTRLTVAINAPAGFRGTFRSDADACAVYSESAGIARVIPIAVAVPADPSDLALLVRWASESHVALIPRGSGSSMAGGAIGPGVIVDLSRWRSIGPIDVVTRRVWVGAGAVCADVDRAARAQGLRFPVDPSSAPFCTIGGMTSTNASGAHTLAVGSMRRWVQAIDCVFADGSRAELRRGAEPPPVPAIQRFLTAAADSATRVTLLATRHLGVRKDSSGYAVAPFIESGELVDLLVGSEGTLALFVAIELELAPQPEATMSLMGAFSSLESAAAAAERATAMGAVACELLDRTFIEILATHDLAIGGIAESEAVLLVEVEGADPTIAAEIARRVAEGFRELGATAVELAVDAETEHRLWALRHAASPILARLDPSLRSMQLIEDGAVPPGRLAEYVRGVRAALGRHETRGVVFGHAGDAHVHVNALIDVTSNGWTDRLASLLNDVTELVASLGGTIAGEHGDGRLRTPLLARVWSPAAREAFALVKRCFDPDGVLNPGVKIALPGENGLASIKYDPTLAPLPPHAATALATVERDRAYSQFRLDLLGRLSRST